MEQEGGTISHTVGPAGVLPLALPSLRIRIQILVISLPGQPSGAEVASRAADTVHHVPRFFLVAHQCIGCCSFYSQPYSLMLWYYSLVRE